MQPVALLPAGWGEERPQVVVHGPASLRVEGLGIEDLVVLVSFR